MASVAVVFEPFVAVASTVVAISSTAVVATAAPAVVGLLPPVEGVLLDGEVCPKGFCPRHVNKLASGFTRAEALGKLLMLVSLFLLGF